jgi:hypothetical protein
MQGHVAPLLRPRTVCVEQGAKKDSEDRGKLLNTMTSKTEPNMAKHTSQNRRRDCLNPWWEKTTLLKGGTEEML